MSLDLVHPTPDLYVQERVHQKKRLSRNVAAVAIADDEIGVGKIEDFEEVIKLAICGCGDQAFHRCSLLQTSNTI